MSTPRSAAQKLVQIQAQLKQVQAAWPLDPLRRNQPELQISSAISKAIDRVFSNSYKHDRRPLVATTTTPEERDKATLQGAQRMLASLQNLSDGSISRKYPFPESMRHPASFPRHYEELNEGVERATRGESLPWYRRWIRFT
ncbi:hypothetical protein PCANC_06743 [Puccinia coronata f. sp. avenae]|uniref:Uncharacterized protein n=1 Tax=Puccinia coronata f. sp. avenae TaxID=200324 RepID=A0A2N5U3I6_9BASI|nr:hypothetical protein PCANC_21431 [Puccinia coronata f. sp. avenae]PLW32296.1 hypothetical protein PCASD_14206 [Puccinia coronata f. sp. avenae]PLW48134.1 hypothetical protein PCANC_06743 [Puccinia coronata f. sp. avenae]